MRDQTDILVTVAICTLNRADSLRRALNSLVAMNIPDGLSWELVVVNNGCMDLTDKIIKSFEGQLPIRREFEALPGLSRARNRAVETAKGKCIIWTDDDVVVDAGWLAAYVAAFERWPQAAFFGGAIIPQYELPVAEWVLECKHLVSAAYAERNLGNAPLLITRNEGPDVYGANFAIRAAEQKNFPYDNEFGLASSRERLGEESKVIGEILASGAIGYWLPDARVEHVISCARQTPSYLIRYFAASGETTAFARRKRETSPRFFGVPRWLWRRVAESWVLYQVHHIISPAPVWMVHLKRFGLAKGHFRYWWNC